jgi:aldehyde dehydrogenase (NAD+)
MEYIAVYFEKTSTGCVTNYNGEFFLTDNSGRNIIVIDAIGYKTRRITLNSSRTSGIKIKMQPESIRLEGAVVRPIREKYRKKENPAVELIRNVIETVYSADEITVIGNELEFDEVLSGRYDYVFATGSTGVGRKILHACAENLTPATLELGGKNPCIVHRNANLKIAAKRIVWSKFLNGGQSCAAPDHLWVHRDVKQDLLLLIAKYVRKFYGEHPLENPDCCKMPDADAYNRVCRLLEKGRLIIGGERAPQRLAIEPTVVDQISPDDPEFAGEIFGPLLPVFDYVSEADVVARIRAGEKPLAIYCFGGNRSLRHALQYNCSSGALVFDDAAVHFANANVPFGGVGASGMGAYHGKKSFSTFVHYKPVMRRATCLDSSLRYPPFSNFFRRLLELFCH